MRRIFRAYYTAAQRFTEDDGFAVASHIALSILTSLFPFLIFVTALASLFGERGRIDALANLLFQGWPPQAAEPVIREIRAVLSQPQGGLLTLGALLALYFSTSAVEALRLGLERAYDEEDPRPWWLLRLKSLLFVFLGALALVAMGLLLVMGPQTLDFLSRFIPGIGETFAPLNGVVRYGALSLILVLGVVVCHKYLPAGDRRLSMIWPGAVLTVLGSLAFGAAFSLYLSSSANSYIATYAGLASIMIVLVFLNFLGAIFIFGAEVNRALADGRHGPLRRARLNAS